MLVDSDKNLRTFFRLKRWRTLSSWRGRMPRWAKRRRPTATRSASSSGCSSSRARSWTAASRRPSGGPGTARSSSSLETKMFEIGSLMWYQLIKIRFESTTCKNYHLVKSLGSVTVEISWPYQAHIGQSKTPNYPEHVNLQVVQEEEVFLCCLSYFMQIYMSKV